MQVEPHTWIFSVTFYRTIEVTDLSITDVARNIMVPASAGIIMYLAVIFLRSFVEDVLNDFHVLLGLIVFGVLIYMISAWILCRREVVEALDLIGIKNKSLQGGL